MVAYFLLPCLSPHHFDTGDGLIAGINRTVCHTFFFRPGYGIVAGRNDGINTALKQGVDTLLRVIGSIPTGGGNVYLRLLLLSLVQQRN